MVSVLRTILISIATCSLWIVAFQSPVPPLVAAVENKYIKVMVVPPSTDTSGAPSDCVNSGVPFVRVFIPREISYSHPNDPETTNFERIRAFYVATNDWIVCSGTQYWSEVFVDLKAVPPKAKFKDDAMDLDSAHNQILLENGRVRVLYFHLGPGESEPVVDLRARVIVVMTDSKEISTFPDGHFEERSNRAGEVSFDKAGREATKNTGLTTLRNIIVELKSPQ
jgi:hypothetical protein